MTGDLTLRDYDLESGDDPLVFLAQPDSLILSTGHSDDFLGQYHRNSHVPAALRYSF